MKLYSVGIHLLVANANGPFFLHPVPGCIPGHGALLFYRETHP